MDHIPRRGCYVLHLSCSKCSEEGQFADGPIQTLAQALKAAKESGWVVIEGKEVCPNCRFKEAHAKVLEKHKGVFEELAKAHYCEGPCSFGGEGCMEKPNE